MAPLIIVKATQMERLQDAGQPNPHRTNQRLPLTKQGHAQESHRHILRQTVLTKTTLPQPHTGSPRDRYTYVTPSRPETTSSATTGTLQRQRDRGNRKARYCYSHSTKQIKITRRRIPVTSRTRDHEEIYPEIFRTHPGIPTTPG